MQMFKKKVLIIGGGIIGLCSAWYLQKAGYQVTIIDKAETGNNCSTGNAGLFRPTHMIPLASPGVVTHALKDLRKTHGFFHLTPLVRISYYQFLNRFRKAASKKENSASMNALKELLLFSKKLYMEMQKELNLDFHKKGLVVAGDIKNKKSLMEKSKLLQANGLTFIELPSEKISNLTELHFNNNFHGVLYPDDFHLDPEVLTHKLRIWLQAAGTTFIQNETVLGFVLKDQAIIGLKTDINTYSINELIIATGFQSPALLKQLGIKLLMEPGKGYSLTWTNESIKTATPAILSNAHIAISKTPGKLRITGCMEVGDYSFTLNQKRIQTIYNQAKAFVPELDQLPLETAKLWCGHRPLSFDGLPYIGRSSKYKNLIIATGHSMSGMSMGAGTGLLVSQICNKQSPEIDITKFNPER